MAREMKDSGIEWVGEIPREWDIIPIKYLCSYNDEVLLEGTAPDFTFDYIEIGSVEYGKGIVDMQHIQFADAPSRARRFVRENDIIVSTVRTYLKAVAAIPYSDKPIVVSTGFVVIRPKNVDPIFLRYAILSDTTISLIESYSVGISYPAINASQVVEFKIPIPKPKEQQAIADFLDTQCAHIDSVIEKTRAAIEEYKKLKQSVITQAVTKGIRPNRDMKDSGIEWIGEIPKEWSLIRIKWLLKERNERSVSGNEEPLSMSQKYGLIPTSQMDMIPNMASSFVGAKLCYKNDLVFNKLKAHLGVFAVSNFDGLVSPDYAVYYSTNIASLKYLEYLFKTPQYIGEFRKKSTGVGAGLTRLYTSGLYSIYCALPDFLEQTEIVTYIDEKTAAIDSLIQKKEQLITELEAYKKSLIYEYVTGKKEVV